MKKILSFIFFLNIISCDSKDIYSSDHSLSLYYRDIGGNNGFISYLDVVAINNYQNKTFSIKQLYNLAKNYVDTVKADRPVSTVTFIGKSPRKSLPNPNDDLFDSKKNILL